MKMIINLLICYILVQLFINYLFASELSDTVKAVIGFTSVGGGLYICAKHALKEDD